MKTILIIVVVFLVLLGAWWLLRPQKGMAPIPSSLGESVEAPITPPQTSSLPSTLKPSQGGPVSSQRFSSSPTQPVSSPPPAPPKEFDVQASFTASSIVADDETALTSLNISMVARELVGNTINGIELKFAAQGLPRVWATHLSGYLDAGDWQCLVMEDETRYRCEGSTALRLNEASMVQFDFRSEELALPAVPAVLKLGLLRNGTVLHTVPATRN